MIVTLDSNANINHKNQTLLDGLYKHGRALLNQRVSSDPEELPRSLRPSRILGGELTVPRRGQSHYVLPVITTANPPTAPGHQPIWLLYHCDASLPPGPVQLCLERPVDYISKL